MGSIAPGSAGHGTLSCSVNPVIRRPASSSDVMISPIP
jgi:hypothetical protein